MITLVLAAMGFLSPASRGALLTVAVLLHIIMSGVAGFVAVALWGQVGGGPRPASPAAVALRVLLGAELGGRGAGQPAKQSLVGGPGLEPAHRSACPAFGLPVRTWIGAQLRTRACRQASAATPPARQKTPCINRGRRR